MLEDDLTYDDLIAAANFIRKYAYSVETRLYMDMTVVNAQTEIKTSYQLASKLDAFAEKFDTTVPKDLG